MDSPKKPTRAMVAKKAGVSLSTVSYVLNKSRYVSPELAEKVNNAIKELNYYPDQVARSMVTKKSKMLTIIANDLTNSMYGEIVIEFERASMERGYAIHIFSGLYSMDHYVNMLLARRIDGLFYLSVPNKLKKTDLDALINHDVSIVCGNYLFPEENRVNRVDVDYYNGMKIAIDHLVSLNHKNIVYLNGMEADYALDEKARAFISIMKNDHNFENPKIIYGFGIDKLTDVEGKILARRLMEQYPDTTAIICYSDLMAYGVMQELRAMGKSVPGDISIVGIENLVTSRFTYPPLTSVSFDRGEFASKVVDTLLHHIKTKEIKKDLVKMNLCIRESTTPCKI